VSMWKRFTWKTVAVALALAGFCSPASGRTGVPELVRVGNAMIACYHPVSHRYTAEKKPSACDLTGLEGEGKRFVSYPIQKMRWAEWGEFRSQASNGVNSSNRIRIRVIAFRRVRCRDGRVFYSAVNVVEPGNGSYYVVRLPTCEVSAENR
jgi:hypothetical protein